MYIFISSLWCRGKTLRWVPPLNTQRLQNSAETDGKRNISTLGSLCLPCSVRDTAWSWFFFKFLTSFKLTGGGVALNTAIRISGLNKLVTTDYGKHITNLSWNPSILIVCLVSVILANIMSGVAACCVFLPFVLNMVCIFW